MQRKTRNKTHTFIQLNGLYLPIHIQFMFIYSRRNRHHLWMKKEDWATKPKTCVIKTYRIFFLLSDKHYIRSKQRHLGSADQINETCVLQKMFQSTRGAIFDELSIEICLFYIFHRIFYFPIKFAPARGIMRVFMCKMMCVLHVLLSSCSDKTIAWSGKRFFFGFEYCLCVLGFVFTSICESFLLIDDVWPVLCTEFIVDNF